jgi:hypothetical protein
MLSTHTPRILPWSADESNRHYPTVSNGSSNSLVMDCVKQLQGCKKKHTHDARPRPKLFYDDTRITNYLNANVCCKDCNRCTCHSKQGANCPHHHHHCFGLVWGQRALLNAEFTSRSMPPPTPTPMIIHFHLRGTKVKQIQKKNTKPKSVLFVLITQFIYFLIYFHLRQSLNPAPWRPGGRANYQKGPAPAVLVASHVSSVLPRSLPKEEGEKVGRRAQQNRTESSKGETRGSRRRDPSRPGGFFRRGCRLGFARSRRPLLLGPAVFFSLRCVAWRTGGQPWVSQVSAVPHTEFDCV